MRTHQLPNNKRKSFAVGRLTLMAGMCLLFAASLRAQTPFTITWTGLGGSGTTGATGVPAGITIVSQYNGVTTSCSTSGNGSATYSTTIQAASGYNVTITSIGGSAYASTAGWKKYTLQLTNGSVYTQTNTTTIPTSSSCSGNTALNTFSVPAAGQALSSGSSATVTVLRGLGGSESGGGYSWTKSLTITGIVTPICNVPTALTAANITSDAADLSWTAPAGASGFEYVIDQVSTEPTGAGTATTATSFTQTGLSESTTYFLHVRTDCGSGNYSSWTSVMFTTTAACDVPTALTAANVTDAAADLSWTAPAGASGFEYVIDQVSTDPTGTGTATTATFFTQTGLSESTMYFLHVRTDCGSGNYSSWTTLSFTTIPTPCPAPTGLAAVNVTDMTADLSWTAQTGITDYEYVVDEVSTDPATAGTVTTSTSYSATGLSESTTYFLHVRTECTNGQFSPWTTISFTTIPTPCPAPTGLAAVNVTDMTADLSWTAQTGITDYEYVVDEVSTDPATAGTVTTSTSYSATGLSESTTYFLHVRTECSNGQFSPWTTLSFTTIPTPCPAPTGLAAVNVTDMTADLSWTAQTGITDYEYVVDEMNADPATAGTVTTPASYSATGLSESTTYFLHVRTECTNGQFSPWTTLSFTTIPTPCPAPTGLAAVNVTDMTADLSWTAQTGITDYEYVVDEVSTDPATAGTVTTSASYSATGLSESTTYFLHVRTECTNGQFSPWITLSFTTIPTPCPAPTGLAAANVTGSSANLSWTAQTGVNGYEYVFDQSNAAPSAAGTAITATTFQQTGLSHSTTYYLHVRTQCANGQFSPWTTILVTTANNLGLNELSAQELISVFPNPVTNLLTLKPVSGQGTAVLTNTDGKQLVNVELNDVTTIDMSTFPSGVYFVRFVQDNAAATVKVVKL